MSLSNYTTSDTSNPLFVCSDGCDEDNILLDVVPMTKEAPKALCDWLHFLKSEKILEATVFATSKQTKLRIIVRTFTIVRGELIVTLSDGTKAKATNYNFSIPKASELSFHLFCRIADVLYRNYQTRGRISIGVIADSAKPETDQLVALEYLHETYPSATCSRIVITGTGLIENIRPWKEMKDKYERFAVVGYSRVYTDMIKESKKA